MDALKNCTNPTEVIEAMIRVATHLKVTNHQDADRAKRAAMECLAIGQMLGVITEPVENLMERAMLEVRDTGYDDERAQNDNIFIMESLNMQVAPIPPKREQKPVTMEFMRSIAIMCYGSMRFNPERIANSVDTLAAVMVKAEQQGLITRASGEEFLEEIKNYCLVNETLTQREYNEAINKALEFLVN